MITYEVGMRISKLARPLTTVAVHHRNHCGFCGLNVRKTQEPWIVIDGLVMHWLCVMDEVLMSNWKKSEIDALNETDSVEDEETEDAESS